MLVVVIFGWTGGKLLVSTSYADDQGESEDSRGSKGADPLADDDGAPTT